MSKTFAASSITTFPTVWKITSIVSDARGERERRVWRTHSSHPTIISSRRSLSRCSRTPTRRFRRSCMNAQKSLAHLATAQVRCLIFFPLISTLLTNAFPSQRVDATASAREGVRRLLRRPIRCPLEAATHGGKGSVPLLSSSDTQS